MLPYSFLKYLTWFFNKYLLIFEILTILCYSRRLTSFKFIYGDHTMHILSHLRFLVVKVKLYVKKTAEIDNCMYSSVNAYDIISENIFKMYLYRENNISWRLTHAGWLQETVSSESSKNDIIIIFHWHSFILFRTHTAESIVFGTNSRPPQKPHFYPFSRL